MTRTETDERSVRNWSPAYRNDGLLAFDDPDGSRGLIFQPEADIGKHAGRQIAKRTCALWRYARDIPTETLQEQLKKGRTLFSVLRAAEDAEERLKKQYADLASQEQRLAQENEDLRQERDALREAIKRLTHFDTDAAREAAAGSVLQGAQSEAVEFLLDACDDIEHVLNTVEDDVQPEAAEVESE